MAMSRTVQLNQGGSQWLELSCDKMSLKLLTAQSQMVEALMGLYMSSVNFNIIKDGVRAVMPGCPQVK